MFGQIKRLFNPKSNPPQQGHFIPNKKNTTGNVSHRRLTKSKHPLAVAAREKAAKTRGGKRRKTKKNARTKKRVSMKKRRSKRNRH